MSESGPDVRFEKLARGHAVDTFECGSPALDDFLRRYALANQAAGGAQTYVATVEERVVGYYSLTASSVEHGEPPKRLTAGLARHRVPVILLARLAVDRRWHGKGLGATLLRDALRRALAAADVIGVRAVLVHAKNVSVRRFYEHFDFDPSPVDPLQLFLLTKDIARLMRS